VCMTPLFLHCGRLSELIRITKQNRSHPQLGEPLATSLPIKKFASQPEFGGPICLFPPGDPLSDPPDPAQNPHSGDPPGEAGRRQKPKSSPPLFHSGDPPALRGHPGGGGEKTKIKTQLGFGESKRPLPSGRPINRGVGGQSPPPQSMGFPERGARLDPQHCFLRETLQWVGWLAILSTRPVYPSAC
jgi:hypothetical protein